MDLVPLFVLSPVLLAVAYCDLRFMRIPNVLVIISLIIFVLAAPLLTFPEIGFRLLSAIIVFIACFIAFALRLLGGGDVKMMAALMLFVPSWSLSEFSLGFSVSMLAGIIMVVSLRALAGIQGQNWVSMQAKGKFPMGVSIALAGLIHPHLIAALL